MLHFFIYYYSDVIVEWNDSASTVLPTIRKLVKGGLRVWVFRWIFYLFISKSILFNILSSYYILTTRFYWKK